MRIHQTVGVASVDGAALACWSGRQRVKIRVASEELPATRTDLVVEVEAAGNPSMVAASVCCAVGVVCER